jgi:hypothetical protein
MDADTDAVVPLCKGRWVGQLCDTQLDEEALQLVV